MADQPSTGAETPQGYAIPYQGDAADFRVYFCAFVALMGVLFAAIGYGPFALVIAVVFGAIAYHFFPLAEKSKPRLGANQYGIFIDGFGHVSWGAIKSLELKTFAVRSMLNQHLYIELNSDVDTALMVDWRNLPWWRLLMKLPWAQPEERLITVEMQPFGESPETIVAELERMWTFYSANY